LCFADVSRYYPKQYRNLDEKYKMNQQTLPDEFEDEQYIDLSPDQERIRKAYVKERKQLEVTEIELNRSKIIMIDEQGRKKKVPLLSEH